MGSFLTVGDVQARHSGALRLSLRDSSDSEAERGPAKSCGRASELKGENVEHGSTWAFSAAMGIPCGGMFCFKSRTVWLVRD